MSENGSAAEPENARERYNLERQEMAKERKNRVLEAAERLFLEKGLEKVSMKDITDEAKVSRATVYRYFPTIVEIIFEIEYRMMDRIMADVPFNQRAHIPEEEVCLNFLLPLIDNFPRHGAAYRYISMFDNLYTGEYPSRKLAEDYKEYINKYRHHFNLSPEMNLKLITSGNVVFGFLQRIAAREDIMAYEQGISIEVQLEELKKMMKREFGIQE